MNPTQSYNPADSEVRIVDQYGNNKVEFTSESYMVERSVQSVSVPGLCVGMVRGQRLIWQLIDSASNQVVESGLADCVMGNFQLNISRLNFSDCKSHLELKAQKEDSPDAPAVTVLRPFCDS